MAEGTVSTYSTETGWGVIVPDDGGPHVRVHQTEIRLRSHQMLERGERVSFTIEQHDGAPHAAAVTPLGPIIPEEELVRSGLVAGPQPAEEPTPAPPPEPDVKLPWPLRAVIVVIGLAALPCFAIGLALVANGHEDRLPLLIAGIVMLLVLERIPHDWW